MEKFASPHSSDLKAAPDRVVPFGIVGFDLDGTLLDSRADLIGAVNHALGLIGRGPLGLDAAQQLIGGGTRAMLKTALDMTGGALPEDDIPPLFTALMDWYEAHLTDASCFYPGAEAMLDALAGQGVHIAVVTNKLERLAVKILDQLGHADRFFTVIGGDTLGPDRAKPAPDLIRLMLDRAPVPAQGARAAYVGDSAFDTRAARAAGLPCVAVTYGFHRGAAADLGADALIDRLDQLIPALAGL